MFKKVCLTLFFLLLFPAMVWSVEVYREGDMSFHVGFWGQAWYQYVDDYRDTNNDGKGDESLNDFMTRRAYFYVKGIINPWFSFFLHYAGDRLGQDGLDNPSVGLGSGLALRDGWITVKLAGDALMLQAGRMYVPFTRNYGTTSTKTLLTTDLDWGQGGVRSGIFYPSKVGRDDSVTLWGNLSGGKFQYRLMIGEGVESSSLNPEDNLRFAGRVSVSLFDPETGWFNKGTYLGKKRVLSIGAGFDYQEDINFSATKIDDYSAWTVDLFWDQPLGAGAITLEAAYIDIDNSANGVTYTYLSSGDDASIVSLKAGYLLPGKVGIGQFQPFVHYQNFDVDKEDDTDVYGFGFNYYIKGLANKISVDFTFVDQDSESGSVQDHFIFTFQIAAGF
ncbi:selenite/tellurite reduction operon porin ExtI [Thermosulfuriphilus sp.]